MKKVSISIIWKITLIQLPIKIKGSQKVYLKKWMKENQLSKEIHSIKKKVKKNIHLFGL